MNLKNFCIVNVSTGYNSSATSIVLSSGEGAKLPSPTLNKYNLVWFNSSDFADPSLDPNVEIIKVDAISTDTLTIIRPALGNNYLNEGSENTAKDHNIAGKQYKLMLASTKSLLDILKDSLRKTENFNNHTNTQTFTDAEIQDGDWIEVVAQVVPIGGWTITATAGSFTITSTKNETSDVPFLYYIKHN